MQDIDEYRLSQRKQTYHWKPSGGRLEKYRKAENTGQVRIPIDGNVYRILRAIADGETRMSWMQGSCFAAWDAEQCLVYGLVKHELGERNDYELTKYGETVLATIEVARHCEYVRPTEIIDRPYQTVVRRIKPVEKREGKTIMVSIKVNEFWFKHFQDHAW